MADERRPTLAEVVLAFQRFSMSVCSGCKRRQPTSGPGADGWIVKTIFKTIPVVGKCPECQTPEERAACAVEDAIGPRYRMHGIGVVKIPRPADGDNPQR